MFVQQLLSRGYGFDERSFGGVTFQKKVGTREQRGGAARAGVRRGRAALAAQKLRPHLWPAGRGHCGRLGTWLHAEPDQPDPS